MRTACMIMYVCVRMFAMLVMAVTAVAFAAGLITTACKYPYQCSVIVCS